MLQGRSLERERVASRLLGCVDKQIVYPYYPRAVLLILQTCLLRYGEDDGREIR